MSYRMGDFQESSIHVEKALKIYPNHIDSQDLQIMLQKLFTA